MMYGAPLMFELETAMLVWQVADRYISVAVAGWAVATCRQITIVFLWAGKCGRLESRKQV